MKISCTNTMVPGSTLTEQALLLKRCGFDGISVFLDIDDWNEPLRQEVLDLEKNTGIHICEFCFSGADYGQLNAEDPALAARSKEIYRQAIAVCNQLGAITEMEFEYAAQSPVPLFHPYRKMNAVQRERFCTILTELAAEVADGAFLLLEPINRYESPFLNNIADNLEILEALQLPRTGILADIFHMSIEEADIPAAVCSAKGWIRHVHLGDNNRLMPGNGSLDWKAIAGALKKIGYDGYVNLECGYRTTAPETELAQQAAFLHNTFCDA